MRSRATIFSLLLAASLGGCFSPGGERQAQRYFVLEAASASAVRKAARATTLLVATTGAAGFYDSQGIVYSRAPGTRAYYQHSSWTERPSRRIHDLLVARLEQSGAFRTVAAAGSGLRGDLVLSTRLEELYHDAAQAPGTVRVALSAELTDPAQHSLVARRTFTGSAPAASYDAPGAVRAINEALGPLLDEVVAWVDQTAPR